MSRLAILGFVFEIVFWSVMSMGAFAGFIYSIAQYPNGNGQNLILGPLGVLFLVFVILCTRAPLKTVLGNGKLTTYGIRGKRTIDLSKIVKVKIVQASPSGNAPSYIFDCLMCTDINGKSIFLQLYGLKQSQRDLFRQPLETAFNQPQVKGYKGESDYQMKKWYQRDPLNDLD